MSDPAAPLSSAGKARLLGRIWWVFIRVVLMARRPLPDQVELLKQGTPRNPAPLPAAKLSRAIDRGLRVGRHTPRCLPKALVMFRLLHEQGEYPVLVIGLPPDPRSHIAHAWVELNGRDVGPPPGRSGHDQLVRYE